MPKSAESLAAALAAPVPTTTQLAQTLLAHGVTDLKELEDLAIETARTIVDTLTGAGLRVPKARHVIDGWIGQHPIGAVDVEMDRLIAAAAKATRASKKPVAAAAPIRGKTPAAAPVQPAKAKAPASLLKGRPRHAGPLQVVYDRLHLPEGTTREEVMGACRMFLRPGKKTREAMQQFVEKVFTMEGMETTVRIQLNRMGKQRGWITAKEQVEGRGLVYRAVNEDRTPHRAETSAA